MVSKIVLVALCLVVAVTAVPAGFGPAGAAGGGGAVWLPPWLANAPWMPKWTATCPVIGSSCTACNTVNVCTPVGGMTKDCTDPTKPYCNLGTCSATPTAECAPAAPAVPATAA